jgi:hypothetical protein
MSDLFVGTYAKPGGKGIYPLHLAPDGALSLRECAAPALNSSFGAHSAAHGLHYLVDECDSRVCAWRRQDDDWKRVADLPSSGEEPCFLALDREGGRLAVANYKSGSLALFALDRDGLPIEPPAWFQDDGTGPVEGRQDGPHLHCARFGPEGDTLYAVDLGADHVLRFDLDGAALGDCQIAYRAPPGSGPRHLLFHPERPFALLISELAATLTLLALPGSPYLYEGEELGLEQDQVPPTARQDPIWLRSGGTVPGRDGCRTPVPWTSEPPGHGFTTGTPWLPFGEQASTRSVEAEDGDAASALAFYRRALALRRQLRGDLDREVRWLEAPDGVLAFARSHADGGTVVCALNTGDVDRALDLPDAQLLLASRDGVAAGVVPAATAVWLRTEV